MTNQLEEVKEQARIMQAVQEIKRGSSAGGILNRGQGEMVQDISDPTELVPMWIAATGEPREVPIWTLEGKNSILLRRDENGDLIWATEDPGGYEAGNVPCRLSAAHPDRGKYRKMGILMVGGKPNCEAEHLASVFEETEHCRLRHRREWASIQANETSIREQKLAEVQALQMQVLLGQQKAQEAAEKAGK